MDSPFLRALDNYRIIKDHLYDCSSNLNIDGYSRPDGLGSSASGMVFAKGKVNGISVFVKIFQVPCDVQVIIHGTRTIRRTKHSHDINSLEIGLTKYLSDNFLLPGHTQNITFLYKMLSCDPAYDVSVSRCTRLPIAPGTLVSNSDTPQYDLMSRYQEGQLDDRVNLMVVEECDGDLENLFRAALRDLNSGRLPPETFDSIWTSILLQLVLTLAMLNDHFDGFYHQDLGPRNILYSVAQGDDTYVSSASHQRWDALSHFSYVYKGKEYLVENTGFVPKLWDFSHVRIGDHVKELVNREEYFSYLRPQDEIRGHLEGSPIPNLPQLSFQLLKIINELGMSAVLEESKVFKIINVMSNSDYDNYPLFLELLDTYIPPPEAILIPPRFE